MVYLDMKLYTFDSKKGREVVAGTLKDNVFIKKVSPKHYMYKERGYGIQEDVLQRLSELKCEKVQIHTSSAIYESFLYSWFDNPVKNYGHGNQRFLSLCEGQIIETKGKLNAPGFSREKPNETIKAPTYDRIREGGF